MVRSSILLPVLLCAAVTVAAQTPAQERPASPPPAVEQATPQQPATQQPAPQLAAKVTYTGCLKPGTTPGSWILDSADATPAAKATVGTSGAMKTTLSLSAKPGTDLKPHANHKIEVVGTVAPAKPGAASSQEPALGQTAPRQELTVESLKMVSTTCP